MTSVLALNCTLTRPLGILNTRALIDDRLGHKRDPFTTNLKKLTEAASA